MDNQNLDTAHRRSSDDKADRQVAVAHDNEQTAEASVPVDTAFYIEHAEISAWIDSIGTEHELPVPWARYRRLG